jgi:hypothetical protein
LVIGSFNLTAVVTYFYIRNYKFITSWTSARPPVLTKNVCLEEHSKTSVRTLVLSSQIERNGNNKTMMLRDEIQLIFSGFIRTACILSQQAIPSMFKIPYLQILNLKPYPKYFL